MGIYIITLFFLVLFSLAEIKYNNSLSYSKLSKIMTFIAFFLLVFQMGFRWETGTDWEPYYQTFKYIDKNSIKLNFGMEKGYLLLNILIKHIYNNYSFFLLIHSIIIYILLFNAFKSFTPYFFTAILFYYCFFMGLTGSNRQLLALVLCLIGLKELIKGRNMYFFIYIIAACFFHLSALLFLIYYFLNRKFSTKTILFALIICILIGYSNLPIKLFSFFGIVGDHASHKVTAYLLKSEMSSGANLSLMGLFKRLVFCFLFIFSRNIISKTYENYNLYLNGYLFGIAIYFLFSKSLLIMVNRGSLYFNIMEPILLSYLLLFTERIKYKELIIVIICFISILFFYQSISGYQDLFIPYKGIFINEDFFREMY